MQKLFIVNLMGSCTDLLYLQTLLGLNQGLHHSKEWEETKCNSWQTQWRTAHVRPVMFNRQLLLISRAINSFSVGNSYSAYRYDEFHPFLFAQHVKSPYLEFETFDKVLSPVTNRLHLWFWFRCLVCKNMSWLQCDSRSQAVDEFFSKMESQKIDMKALQQEKQALKKLENVKRDHEQRLEALHQAQVSISQLFTSRPQWLLSPTSFSHLKSPFIWILLSYMCKNLVSWLSGGRQNKGWTGGDESTCGREGTTGCTQRISQPGGLDWDRHYCKRCTSCRGPRCLCHQGAEAADQPYHHAFKVSPPLPQKQKYHRPLCSFLFTTLVHLLSSRNPYISEEDHEDEEKKDAVEEKGKKNKNKGQQKKLQKNKPMLVDVDLGLSAYANAKK